MAAPDTHDIWTLRGVTGETREKFKAAARSQGISIGQLANDVLSSAADTFSGRTGRSTALDSSASFSQEALARLTQLETRVAILEASRARRSTEAQADEFDALANPEDLLVSLYRSIEGLSQTDNQPLRPATTKLLALLPMLPARRALDELLTVVIREALDLSGNVLLSNRIGAAVVGLGPTQRSSDTDSDENVGA